MISIVVQCTVIALLMIGIVVQCIGIKLLMLSTVMHCIAYDKHRCALRCL